MIRILMICAGLAISVVLLAGCEWSGAGSDNTWNERVVTSGSNTVDFSGSYKSPSGGVLVRSFSSVTNYGVVTNTTTTTNSVTTTNQVSGQQIGVGDGKSTAFSGVLAGSVYPGSLTIIVGGYHFVDSVSSTTGTVNLAVTPPDGSAGTLNYGTRLWTLSFPTPIAGGTPILASYMSISTYGTTNVITVVSNTVSTNSFAPGNHGNPIFSFVVFQMGNKLQIYDSNNALYEGYLGAVVYNPAGVTVDQSSLLAQAQFGVKGNSQGYAVEIVGVLRRTTVVTLTPIGISSNNIVIYESKTVGGYEMAATYIEENGYQADVSATCAVTSQK